MLNVIRQPIVDIHVDRLQHTQRFVNPSKADVLFRQVRR